MLRKIISGGQTGADRAALDFAIDHGIPHGGWCPARRAAEDGPIDLRYRLTETPSEDYTQRTEWNVRDSDGTVVFSLGVVITGGSRETVELARKHGRPCLHVCAEADADTAPSLVARFIREHGIEVLNVAGPRASHEPGVGAFVMKTLKEVQLPHAAA
ncbi:MAG TPA: putative molybdenum carrier protein [Verrucomicrobiota bacterium]|nr:putative molybdenum carrier protein [Verrucomicrobiota bacterium]